MNKLLKKIFLGLNLVAAAALLFSYTAVFIRPSITVIPSFFGLAYPYIFLVNLLFVIGWGMKLKKQAILSLIVILIGLNQFNNYFRFGRKNDKVDGIKVLSYNVRLFNRYMDNGNSLDDITGFISETDPDIICLQEFYFEGEGDTGARFAGMLEGSYYVHSKVTRQGRNGRYGIVTLSKYPIANRGDIVHTRSASLSIYSDLILGNDTVRIYNNHLQSFRLRKIKHSLIEEISGFNQEGKNNGFKDISYSLKQGFIQRAGQSRLLRDHINSSPYHVIICGDFNDTPVSYSYRKIRGSLNDSFVESGHGTGFTYKDIYPPNRIDYILYDESFDCTGFSIVRVKYSDHYPVLARFSPSF